MSFLPSNAKFIAVSKENRDRFITEYLGAEGIAAEVTSQFFWLTGEEAKTTDLEKRLINSGWVKNIDWGYYDNNLVMKSRWTKGGQQLIFVVLYALQDITIKAFADDFGITGETPGSTVFLVYIGTQEFKGNL